MSESCDCTTVTVKSSDIGGMDDRLSDSCDCTKVDLEEDG